MIHSLELEQHLLAALIRHPDQYGDVAGFIDIDDLFFKGVDPDIGRTGFPGKLGKGGLGGSYRPRDVSPINSS